MATSLRHTRRHAQAPASQWWRWPLTRRSARATLRAHLHLPADDRVLMKLAPRAGDEVVATTQALYWRPPGTTWLRLGWDEIVRIEQNRAGTQLTLVGLLGGVAQRATLRVRPGSRLIPLVQERIAATRIVTTHVTIDGRHLWIEARRQPGTARPHWYVRPRHGTELDDPQLPRIIDRAVGELQKTLGLGETVAGRAGDPRLRCW